MSRAVMALLYCESAFEGAAFICCSAAVWRIKKLVGFVACVIIEFIGV